MQQIIVRINWNYYALPIAALPYLNQICEVKEKQVGSVRKFYVEKETSELDIRIEIVQTKNIVFKEEEEVIAKDYETIIKDANENVDYYCKAYLDSAKKVKELEEKMSSLLCRVEEEKCQN